MKDKTENLEKAFRYIREFYNQVARMVSDIMNFMSKKGWESPGGAVTDGLSYSLDYPDKWMWYYIYKNFLNKKIESHIKGVLVFFNEYMNDFPISIVCGKLNQSPVAYDKWGIYYLALNNKNKLDGLTGEVLSLKTIHDGKTITGDLFAISLSSIKSPEDVKDRIVKKLLEL